MTLPSSEPSSEASARPGLLRQGDNGDEVLALQRRLAQLGYWNGTPDGSFGQLLRQAVIAVQKAAGLTPDGVVGPLTRAAVSAGARPAAHSAHGHVIEVDLPKQLLLLVSDGHVTTILNTSTGGGYRYVDQGRVHVAVTPTGTYAISRQVDGWDRSPLGELWRPKYFNGGIAIHGYESVPSHPASHGCVRVSIAAMDWIWSTSQMPIRTPVLVY